METSDAAIGIRGARRSYDVDARVCGGRRRPQGVEVEIVVEIFSSRDGERCWTSVSTFLARGRAAAAVDAASPLAARIPSVDVAAPRPRAGAFDVLESVGPDVAAFNKDVNPIHTSPVLAKHVFGFEDALAHGMWVLARALRVAGVEQGRGLRVDAAFKGPTYCGRGAEVRAAHDVVEVYSGANPRPTVVARFQYHLEHASAEAAWLGEAVLHPGAEDRLDAPD